MPDLIVSLYYNDLIRSARTGADGAYELTWVPDEIRSYLIVTEADEVGKGEYLPTLQARPFITKGADIFGLELFVLPRKGGMYEGIANEVEGTFETQALFIGQVFVTKADSTMVTFAGAQATSTPATILRYIKSNPRYPEQWGDTTTLHPVGQTATTSIGSFLAIGPPGVGEVTFNITGPNVTFPPIKTPLSAGIIAIGQIEGTSGASIPGADGGSAHE